MKKEGTENLVKKVFDRPEAKKAKTPAAAMLSPWKKPFRLFGRKKQAVEEPPKKARKPLFQLPFRSRAHGILTLYFTEEELRLGLITTNLSGRKEVAYVASLSTRDRTDEEIREKFEEALVELRVKNLRVIGVIPSDWTITRNIEIPSRDPKEIREIVNLQAGRHTPYSRSEIIIDYLDLGVFKSVYTKVLLVIVTNKSVKRYYDLVESVGLQIEKICFAPEAMARSAVKYLGLEHEGKPICFINVDQATSDSLIILNGLVLFVRSIPIGTQHFTTEKDVYVPRFAEEIKRSLDAYQVDNIGDPPSHLLVGGATGGLEGIEFKIQEALQLPVKRWIGGEGMPIRSEAQKIYTNPALSFLNVAAPALFAEDLKADLIPEENKLRRKMEDQSKEIIKTGVLGIMCFGLLCAIFLSQLYFRTAEVDQLTQRFEPIRKEAEDLETAYAQIRTIKSILAVRGRSLETLAELFSLVAEDMYLTDIRYDENSKFSVKGTGLSRSSIYTLVDEMEKSSSFRNVKTKYVIGKIEDGQEFSDFQIDSLFE